FRFLKTDSRRLSPAGETVTLFNYSADISYFRELLWSCGL
ncbi:MAG: hypothetical protein ACI8P0_006048, partial [Planctomycetaceae bacterium]